MNQKRRNDFIQAIKENKVDEMLQTLNVLELIELKHDLGLVRIGEKSLEPMTDENQLYNTIIQQETIKRFDTYKVR